MRRFRKVRHVPLPLLAVMMAAILFAELARCEREGAKETAAEAEKSVPRRAALTFDDGPNACYTPEVLEILKENETSHLIVKNQISGLNTINIKEMFARGYSTKNSDKRGYGLYNVEQIITSHKGCIEIKVESNEIIFDIYFNNSSG